MTRLSDRLNDAKNGVSIVAAVERAKKAGHAIERGTVYRYLKGDHAKNPTDETLEALAFVFDLKVTDLRDLADKPSGELEPYSPPSYANRLNRDQRRALNELIRTIVESADASLTGHIDTEASATVTQLPNRRAARKGEPNLPKSDD